MFAINWLKRKFRAQLVPKKGFFDKQSFNKENFIYIKRF